MRLALEELATINPWVNRSRNFNAYEVGLSRHSFDIVDELISKIKEKEKVVFYDFGCGYGRAGDDIFPNIKNALKEKKEDISLIDKLTYIGLDVGDKFPNVIRNPKKILLRHDIEELGSIFSELPKIDIGLCYWAFPYIERKLETLEAWSSHLSEKGIIIIFPFYEDLTIISDNKNKIMQSEEVYGYCFNQRKIRDSSIKIIEGASKQIKNVLEFRRSEMYHNNPSVKGRLGERVSFYKFKGWQKL